MNLREIVTSTLAAMLFSLVAVYPYLPQSNSDFEYFTFELEAVSSTTGLAQLYFNPGSGYAEPQSFRADITAVAEPRLLRFRLPEATYSGLRFDPLDRAGTVTVRQMRIVSSAGKTVREFAPSALSPAQQIAAVNVHGDSADIVTTPDATDPYVIINIGAPFELRRTLTWSIKANLARWVPVFGVTEVALLGFFFLRTRNARRMRSLPDRVRQWSSLRPQSAIVIVSALGMIASSYPIVFLGKSFVSPNFGPVALLYGKTDTLPGSKSKEFSGVKGSDVGALMWMHLPLTQVAHRAVFKDGELPLWNRYNSTGAPLLGQSQSMLGDPVHMLLPFLFNGAAWSWDLKYLVAKWLFACGLGIASWKLTRSLPSALLIAATADFIGFFLYRVNHPAIFSLCYSPWILVCWIGAAQAVDLRMSARWALGLIIANLAEMASGTAKEAYMLLLCLNLTGLLILALAREPIPWKLRRLAILAGAGVAFVFLTAPIWISFATSLKGAFTVYDNPQAQQVPALQLPGLFDEIFYRPFNGGFPHFPSANFVCLLGFLAFLVYLREAAQDRAVLAIAIGAILPFAIAFGVIPPAWIVRVPILGNIIHVGNTFSCVLIIHVAALAACGFSLAIGRLGSASGRFDIAVAVLLLGALMYPYFNGYQTASAAEFVRQYIVAILVAIVGLMLVFRRILLRRKASPAMIILAITFLVVLTWRFGLQYRVGVADYVLNPPDRADFSEKSNAVETVLADPVPYRAAGFGENLLPGWSDVYGLEGFAGPEPLINRYYRELMDASGAPIVWEWRYIIVLEGLDKVMPFYEFLNVRYFFWWNSDRPRAQTLLRLAVSTDTDVYEPESPWPRAFFTDIQLRYSKPKDLVGLINSRPGQPFAAVQDSEQIASVVPVAAGSVVKPARNYVLTANRTSFDVDATGPGVIVLHEAYEDGNFRLLVNGKPAPYFRVNHLFRGTRVDRPGSYHVEYEYWPRGTTLSLALCATGGAVILAAAWPLFRRARRPRSAILVPSPAG